MSVAVPVSVACDRAWCPNRTQFDALPEEYHAKIDVIPQGKTHLTAA